jgi:hypothetical protein
MAGAATPQSRPILMGLKKKSFPCLLEHFRGREQGYNAKVVYKWRSDREKAQSKNAHERYPSSLTIKY